MKKYLFLIFSLFLMQCATSKISELYQIYNKQDYLYWSEDRELTWNDFQGEQLSLSDNFGGEIHIYNPSTIEKSNMFSPVKLTTICVFDKKHSWINKKFANEDLLLYNQVIFNIYELYTRKLRETFANTNFGLNDYTDKFHKMTEEMNKELNSRIDKFRKESNMGQNKEIIFDWNNQINNELATLNNYKQDLL